VDGLLASAAAEERDGRDGRDGRDERDGRDGRDGVVAWYWRLVGIASSFMILGG
jgi:hypothetical protein